MKVQPAGGARVTPPEGEPGLGEVAESVLVALAVVQGALLGVWLGLFPASVLRAGGFPPAPLFFVRWAGVFHVALAAGYAIEWNRFRRVTLIVVAKGITALFLAATWMGDGLPTLLMIAVLLEAGMALAGLLVHGPAERSRRARARLRLVTPVPTDIRSARQR